MKKIVSQRLDSNFDLDAFNDLKVTSILYSLYSNALGWIACFLLCIGWSESLIYVAVTDKPKA